MFLIKKPRTWSWKGQRVTVIYCLIIWEVLGSIEEDDQRVPRWEERGCIEDFHLIAQKHPPASPISLAAMSEPLINHTSFQWSRGQIRERGGPSVRLPGWNNPGSTGREHRRQDEGLKGKKEASGS